MARRSSNHTPLMEGPTDYAYYLRKLARREDGRNKNISEDVSGPKELLYIARLDQNKISTGPLDFKLPNGSEKNTETMVEYGLVRTLQGLVTTKYFKVEKLEQVYAPNQHFLRENLQELYSSLAKECERTAEKIKGGLKNMVNYLSIT